MRPSRRLLAGALLLASLGSCAKKEASEIVLVFSSTMTTGDGGSVEPDFKLLEIGGERSGNEIYAPIDVGRISTGIKRFPASTVLFNRDDNISPSTSGNLRIRGFPDDSGQEEQVLFSQDLIFNLVSEQRRVMTLPLQMACVKVVCTNGQTCFDGACIDPPNVDASKLPLYDESTDPTRKGAPCLNTAAAGPCVSNSVRVSSRAIVPADDNDGTCVVRVPREKFSSFDGANIPFNVSAVWTETQGRYEVLDQITELNDGYPGRKPANSWRAEASLGSGPVTFTLPPGICQHAPYSNNKTAARLQQLVFSVSSASGCSAKSPSNQACDRLPDEISADKFACVMPDYAIGAEGNDGCRACLVKQVIPAVVSCANDDGCKQVLVCQLACRALHDTPAICSTNCQTADACISKESVQKAKNIITALGEADGEKCKTECGR